MTGRDWPEEGQPMDSRADVTEAEAAGYRSGYLDGLTDATPAGAVDDAERTVRRAMVRTILIESVAVAVTYALCALWVESGRQVAR